MHRNTQSARGALIHRELALALLQIKQARRVLAGLNLQVHEAKAQLIADSLSGRLRDANEQLVVSVLKAHAAAELAERARMDDATSAEFRARSELRAKTTLAAMNADLENRVTERTRELVTARDDALAAARTKEEFLSNMSHEIRTPMNGMLGAMELLSKTTLQPRQAHYIEVAKASGEALLSILNEVLDFAKIDSNRLHLDHAAIDVNAIARSVAELFSAAAERKAIELRFIADPAISGQRLGDALHLRQVLLNLVGNAMKFTPHGQVLLCTRLVGDSGGARVSFEVKDAGIGIEASQLQRIFDPFVQADDPAHGHQGGSGLGLSISRQLVRAMGGELTVESVRGQGSTFRFELRLEVAPEAVVTPLNGSADPTSTEGLSGRVLLVEDNPVNQMVGISMLESLGLEVVATDNGEAALAKMAETAFAMVLMDCQMPVLDGYDATRRLRETECRNSLPRMPVIALTANAFKSDVARCLAAGMDGHLAKPYSAKQLREVITPWLQGAAAATSPLRMY